MRMSRRSRNQVNMLPRAQDLFTDRKEPRKAFWDAYDKYVKDLENGEDPVKVMMFYGIGGIGKSSLLQQLIREMDQCNSVRNRASSQKYIFVNLSGNIIPERINVLDRMRNLLEFQYGYQFPLYDLGVYLYKKRSGEKVEKIDLNMYMDRSPFWKFAVEAIKVTEMVQDVIPGLNVLVKVAKIADDGIKILNRYYYKKNEDKNAKLIEYGIFKAKMLTTDFMPELANLENKDNEFLYDYLPHLFAVDLSENTNNLKEPLVVFLDTYERLVNELCEQSNINDDLWLRDGNYNVITESKNVLWVIAGRERLKWTEKSNIWADAGDALEQHILGNLSEKDSEDFLLAAQIDKRLHKDLYSLTHGTPLYLDLCKDYYWELISKGEKPVIENFGNNNDEIIGRLLQYMDESKRAVVYMLATLGCWNDEIVIKYIGRKVLGDFNILNYETVKELSFINKREGEFVFHKTMREVLIKDEKASEIINSTVDFAKQYYNNLIACNKCLTDDVNCINWIVDIAVNAIKNNKELEFFFDENIWDELILLAEKGLFNEMRSTLNIVQLYAEQEKNSEFYVNYLFYKSIVLYYCGSYSDSASCIKAYLEITDSDNINKKTPRAYEVYLDSLYSMKAYDKLVKETEVIFENILKKIKASSLSCDAYDFRSSLISLFLHILNYFHSATNFKDFNDILNEFERFIDTYRDYISTSEECDLLHEYAILLDYENRSEEALIFHEKVYNYRIKNKGYIHVDSFSAAKSYADCLYGLKKFETAKEIEEECLAIGKNLFGEKHVKTLECMTNLAHILVNTKEFEKALELYKYCYDEYHEIYGDDNNITLHSMGLYFLAAILVCDFELACTIIKNLESKYGEESEITVKFEREIQSMKQLVDVYILLKNEIGEMEAQKILKENMTFDASVTLSFT